MLSLAWLAACQSGKVPDVSHLPVETVVQRFDQDFFAIDTTRLDGELNALQTKYPNFFADYITRLLGVNPADPLAPEAIKAFIRSYKKINDTAQLVAAKALPAAEKDIKLGLQLMRYYFPGYKPDSPFVITSFVAPMDAYEPFAIGDYGDVRTRNGVGIALQLHLGAQASVYEEGRQAGTFFDYQLRRFTPEMMAVNSMKNIVDDAFPYPGGTKPLVEDMIEKGKRLYLLDLLMPHTEDSLKLGYTGAQLKGCYKNEALIWNYFVKNDLLYSKEPVVNQVYIKDGPKTAEISDSAPGYIGLFVGRQIVRAFMKQNAGMGLKELMQKPAAELLNEAKYKP